MDKDIRKAAEEIGQRILGLWDDDKPADIAEIIARHCVGKGEHERLRSELFGVRTYCDDTLSGRVLEPETVEWHREGIKEIRDRIALALGNACGEEN